MESCRNSTNYGSISTPRYVDDRGYFALGSIRNSSYAFETCCQTPGQEYTWNGNDAACYRYCNLTAPGLTADGVKSCVKDQVEKAGIKSGYATIAVDAKDNAGAGLRLGGCTGWLVAGAVLVSAVMGR